MNRSVMCAVLVIAGSSLACAQADETVGPSEGGTAKSESKFVPANPVPVSLLNLLIIVQSK